MFEPLVLHWDGAAWDEVAIAGACGKRDYLAAVSADAASDAWAVGFTGSRPLVRRWDGGRLAVTRRIRRPAREHLRRPCLYSLVRLESQQTQPCTMLYGPGLRALR